MTYRIEQLMDMDNDLLIVLDDYHAILNSEIHQAVKLLVDHLPIHVDWLSVDELNPLYHSLVKGSRSTGGSTHDDLRCSFQETASFLKYFPELSVLISEENKLHQLNNSTEGWAAGLQMVALALHREIIQNSQFF